MTYSSICKNTYIENNAI